MGVNSVSDEIPKSTRDLRPSERRFLSAMQRLGYLGDRYRTKAAADHAQPENWVFVRADGSASRCGIPAYGKH